MPIRLEIENGGEYLLGYARQRLVDLKRQRCDLGIDFKDRWYSIPTGERVYLRSHLDFDLIRILAKSFEFWYSSTVAPTCQCRTLTIIIDSHGLPLPSPPTVGLVTPFTTKVYLSDGTLLGSLNGSETVIQNGSIMANFPGLLQSGVVPDSWTGTSSISFYNVVTDSVNGNSTTLSQTLSIIVPSNVCRPADPSDSAQITANALRERQRLNTCSDAAKTTLKNGVIPGQFLFQNAALHPSSKNAVAGLLPDSVSLIQTHTRVDSIIGTINVTTIQANRTVTFQYTPAATNDNLNPSQKTMTFTGSATQVSYFLAIGTSYYTFEYNAFPAVDIPIVLDQDYNKTLIRWDTDGGNNSGALSTTPLSRFSGYFGPLHTNFPSMNLRSVNGIYRTAGTAIYALDGTITLPDGTTFAGSPPIDSLMFTVPDDLKEFYALSKPKPDKTANSFLAWSSTFPADREIITIIPISYVHSDFGDLGMFPQVSDVTDLMKLTMKIDTVVDYRYKYSDGTFTFVRSRSIHDINRNIVDSTTFAIPAGTNNTNINCLFVSRAAPYADLQDQYKKQRARIGVSADKRAALVPALTANETLLATVRDTL